MQRYRRIFLFLLVAGSLGIETSYGQSKQSIATGEFLSVLAKNVATVLSPTLVGELQDGRPNRTATNATIRTTTESSKSEASTESSKYSGLEADTVRSAQTQSEVRPGNNGFPFNFDENNYRYNYPGLNPGGVNHPGINPGGINSGINSGLNSGINHPGGLNPGINSQGFPFRQDFGFPNPGYYNPDFYRDNYRGFSGQDGNFRGSEGNSQRGENVNGVAPVESAGEAQTGRSPDPVDVSGPNLERYRNFERLQLNPQFNNFGNSPYSARQQEGRFGQSFYDGLNPNFSNNPNFQNSIGNGYPRNLFQPVGDNFDRQRFRSNNFDFLPSQRFQNPFDNNNYPRSLQRGPNFPGPYPFLGIPREIENLVSPKIGGKKNEEASSSETRPKSEILKSGNVTNSTTKFVSDEKPEILSVQGRIRFGRILLPTLDDYDDVRFRPDDFREYLLTPENKTVNKTVTKPNNSTINDV